MSPQFQMPRQCLLADHGLVGCTLARSAARHETRGTAARIHIRSRFRRFGRPYPAFNFAICEIMLQWAKSDGGYAGVGLKIAVPVYFIGTKGLADMGRFVE